jgi:hypothetical protein
MSRVWLVIGMIVSLLVPGGFAAMVAIGAALDTTSTTYDYSSTSEAGEAPSYTADDDAASTWLEQGLVEDAFDTLEENLKELVRLNRLDSWGPNRSARARAAALDLRTAAVMLEDYPDWRRVALKAAAFALALDRFGKDPCAATYDRYERARKALNRAIRMGAKHAAARTAAVPDPLRGAGDRERRPPATSTPSHRRPRIPPRRKPVDRGRQQRQGDALPLGGPERAQLLLSGQPV